VPAQIIQHPAATVKIYSVNALAAHIDAHPDHIRRVLCKAPKDFQPVAWREWRFVRVSHDWLAVHERDIGRLEFVRLETRSE
jgi:hypothetical protein